MILILNEEYMDIRMVQDTGQFTRDISAARLQSGTDKHVSGVAQCGE